MARIYSPTNKIRFTSLSENYNVHRNFKAALSGLYSSVILYVIKHYDGTLAYKQMVVRVINILTYAAYAAEILPSNWSITNPFVNIPDIDDADLEDTLGEIYLTVDAIEWDIEVVDTPTQTTNSSFTPVTTVSASNKPVEISKVTSVKDVSIMDTPNTDLYIQSPEIPQFDITKPWIQKQCGSDLLTIYTTLPEIPKRQRDISITTNVDRMTDSDLLNLYPNRYIHTRAPIMYEPQTNMDFDKDLGVILPIDDYSKDQVLSNIIRYPHLYKLARWQEDRLISFYAYMEIDGELVDTLEVWDSLEISKWIPKQAEFIKEYVTRKYLMDIEYKGFVPKYPIYGTLDPYLTLFMPVGEYAKRGFNVVDLARQCVKSRVSYKQSRSPILRRIQESNE